jgi:hypothetical protein
MKFEESRRIKDNLKEKGKMIFTKGATENQIVNFEKKNGITLPTKYKEWLQLSDGGEFYLPSGLQMYGVVHKPIIDVDDNDKPDDKYIVIGALASGDPILCEENSEKISIFNHEDGHIEEDEIYEDFYSFLNDLHELLGIGE